MSAETNQQELRVEVNAQALHRVLTALNGPSHHIAELQAIRSLGDLVEKNPIDVLIDEYNAWAEKNSALSGDA